MGQNKKTAGRTRPTAKSIRFRDGRLRLGNLGPARITRFGSRDPGPFSERDRKMLRLLLGCILDGAGPAGPGRRRVGRARISDILRLDGLDPAPDGPQAFCLALDAIQGQLSLVAEPESRPEGSSRVLYVLLKIAGYDPDRESVLVYSPYLDELYVPLTTSP